MPADVPITHIIKQEVELEDVRADTLCEWNNLYTDGDGYTADLVNDLRSPLGCIVTKVLDKEADNIPLLEGPFFRMKRRDGMGEEKNVAVFHRPSIRFYKIEYPVFASARLDLVEPE
jgi:hypothetical protein